MVLKERSQPRVTSEGVYTIMLTSQRGPLYAGGPPRTLETKVVRQKYVLHNPTDQSLWIYGRYTHVPDLIEVRIEYRLDPEGQTAREWAAQMHKSCPDQWHAGEGCGLDGTHVIEVKPRSSIPILVPVRTVGMGHDIIGMRIPCWRNSGLRNHDETEVIQLPLQALLSEEPKNVDWIVEVP